MEMTKELMDKAKAAKTVEELLQLAKAEGIELGQEEAAAAFAQLHKTGELANEELENVTGGGCSKPGSGLAGTEYYKGDLVYYKDGGSWVPARILEKHRFAGAYWYTVRTDSGKTEEKVTGESLRRR